MKKEPCKSCGWAFTPDCYLSKGHDAHELGETVMPGSPLYQQRVRALVDAARGVCASSDELNAYDCNVDTDALTLALEPFNGPDDDGPDLDRKRKEALEESVVSGTGECPVPPPF